MVLFRRRCAGLLFEAGANVPYVMAQMGHTDPRVTLGIYARVVREQTEVQDRFDQLIRGTGKGSEKAAELINPILKEISVTREARSACTG